MTVDRAGADHQPGTDAALLAAGWATATALAWPNEVDSGVLEGLTGSAGVPDIDGAGED